MKRRASRAGLSVAALDEWQVVEHNGDGDGSRGTIFGPFLDVSGNTSKVVYGNGCFSHQPVVVRGRPVSQNGRRTAVGTFPSSLASER